MENKRKRLFYQSNNFKYFYVMPKFFQQIQSIHNNHYYYFDEKLKGFKTVATKAEKLLTKIIVLRIITSVLSKHFLIFKAIVIYSQQRVLLL